MRPVFLDTVGVLAVWDSSGQWNRGADAAYQQVIQRGQPFLTTPLVLWECGNAAARRPFRQRVNVLRLKLVQEGLLREPTQRDIDTAWAACKVPLALKSGAFPALTFP